MHWRTISIKKTYKYNISFDTCFLENYICTKITKASITYSKSKKL